MVGHESGRQGARRKLLAGLGRAAARRFHHPSGILFDEHVCQRPSSLSSGISVHSRLETPSGKKDRGTPACRLCGSASVGEFAAENTRGISGYVGRQIKASFSVGDGRPTGKCRIYLSHGGANLAPYIVRVGNRRQAGGSRNYSGTRLEPPFNQIGTNLMPNAHFTAEIGAMIMPRNGHPVVENSAEAAHGLVLGSNTRIAEAVKGGYLRAAGKEPIHSVQRPFPNKPDAQHVQFSCGTWGVRLSATHSVRYSLMGQGVKVGMLESMIDLNFAPGLPPGLLFILSKRHELFSHSESGWQLLC